MASPAKATSVASLSLPSLKSWWVLEPNSLSSLSSVRSRTGLPSCATAGPHHAASASTNAIGHTLLAIVPPIEHCDPPCSIASQCGSSVSGSLRLPPPGTLVGRVQDRNLVRAGDALWRRFAVWQEEHVAVALNAR